MNFYDDIDRYTERTAIITEKEQYISYAELLKTADRIAAYVPAKSLVFLMCSNTYESLAAYIGFLRKRVVPVLLNGNVDHSLFETLRNIYRPNFIYCPKDRDIAGEEIADIARYHLIKTEFDGKHDIHPDLALLLPTSGSTGSPKLVRQSHDNITSNANSIARFLNIKAEDKPITSLPMSYTYGLSILNSHLLMGAAIIMTDASMVDKRFWTLLNNQGATTFGGVPFTYELLKKMRFARMMLPSIRYLTQAGGKLSKELAGEFFEACNQKGIRFIVMYGQTEATARMSYLPWEYAQSKAGSIGIAIPGGKFSLIGDHGRVIMENNVAGELIYTGENVTLGYAESPEDLNKGDENGGVLHTGDMAERDSDGFYYIVGRKKRFLKLFGTRVNLDEVEAILQKEGFECVCGGTDDHLVIYITNKEKMHEAKILISHKTGLNPSGFTAVPIKEIPRNEAGKVLYSQLEELYG